jgi:hypothetical protein
VAIPHEKTIGGWMGPRVSLGTEEDKNFGPCLKLNSSSVQPTR